jgi:hypothetical protein
VAEVELRIQARSCGTFSIFSEKAAIKIQSKIQHQSNICINPVLISNFYGAISR